VQFSGFKVTAVHCGLLCPSYFVQVRPLTLRDFLHSACCLEITSMPLGSRCMCRYTYGCITSKSGFPAVTRCVSIENTCGLAWPSSYLVSCYLECMHEFILVHLQQVLLMLTINCCENLCGTQESGGFETCQGAVGCNDGNLSRDGFTICTSHRQQCWRWSPADGPMLSEP
jgi:hypothetical protein